ncbi:prolyl aminopeptidase [Sphaerisporangium sp. TRM90804]|uniref:prolyl aminopeptidase n=1 Tax=Sphaerisporangium sp. TRM90804 TaxID=3031113 RepID=UPI002448393D|nr:prolyl aminopeptidase [Sphaerisporangium sp. TRM90804]MDH2429566.1 prolyl aminopeptidase [Sphaerisporangium sp. TRM90804]
MRTFYPEIEPYETGVLDVGDGQRLYWELCGDPRGKPAVFLHGGPGGGCLPAHRRLFDPEAYRVLLFDQRGCGRSTPRAGAGGASLSANTTWHLVRDIERLRVASGVERWTVLGGSWGTTLGLAYAQSHPERVSELILRGVCMFRPRELRWVYQVGGPGLFPDAWEALVAPIPEHERGDLVAAYHRRVNDPDPAVRAEAALAWSVWEGSTAALLPRPDLVAMHARADVALGFARIELHYLRNHAFLAEDQLLRDAGRLRDVPGVIVQGRYDMCTPPFTAWELHRAWPRADFVMVEGAGHAGDEPATLHHVIEATDRFRP